ncbi:prolyl oligopeptidase family serine peptidase [Pseudonocardia sp. RS11V-5]|uniref:alpha/beta hydrolase family protein n=1 Tax=Pseudonocardia terrae TaxID=2905831 RepID=UPI001E497D18|nr:prolyl oligopeptidase family serine peptidase [Pseudonocardia terrae]MCE3551817.1 prolyl oligopeptidase family serine peptidase [Pseudonocardia terrae]
MTQTTERSSTRVRGFTDPELDFQLLRQLGSAVYGGASIGEPLALAAALGDSAAGWTDGFAALAERQRADAEARAAAGHEISARDRFLHACNSFRTAEYFAPAGTPRQVELGLASRAAFLAAAPYLPGRVEELWLPWEDQRLPGYLCTPAADAGPGPTLVATSGFDGTLEETYLQVGRAGLERGWRVLLICGPGQMDVTRTEPHTHFVPDTERWVTPWLDHLLARPEVDPERLALLGISLGGYWVTRAAAHDDRIRAVVANSPIVDLHAYQVAFVAPYVGGDPEVVLDPGDDLRLDDIDHLPDTALPVAAKGLARSLMTRFGRTSLLDTFAYLRAFRVDPTAVACPALALVGSGEGGEPRAQFERFCSEVAGPVTAHTFTAHDGADTHCQLGNLTYSAAVVFDWLEELFARG